MSSTFRPAAPSISICDRRPRPGVASRALFAADRDRLAALITPWPSDIQAQILELFDGETGSRE